MKNLFVIFIITIFLNSCVSENEQVALNKIKELYKTQDVIVSYGFDYGNDRKNIDYIEIKIKDSPIINSDGYNPEFATSTSALSWYLSLTEEQFKKYNTIIVEIGRDEETFRKDYSFDHLSNMTKAYDFLGSYLNNIKNNDYSKAIKYIDSISFNGISEQNLKMKYESVTNELGMMMDFEFYGFGIHQAVGEEDEDVDCIYIWTTSYYEKDNVNVIYLLDLNDRKDRLVGFTII